MFTQFDFEDEGPCIHHRSQFDTLPCPPPEDDSYLSNVVLAFPGGAVVVPKPTREELVLSAQQWATRAHEELFEFSKSGGNGHLLSISSALVRLDAVLAELAAL